MPRHRYQPPQGAPQDDEGLPLQTQLTILTRHSTLKQAIRNVQSDECNPQDLVREARRLGFTDIQVYDWDTGIGAYSTTIEDRPALRYWLNDLLPSGKSRVLMVSQEDRLFRDQWEDQHNAFIRKVAMYGGWVICGLGRPRIYDFREEMDCEQFRQRCKSGKFFIEDHIIRRTLPALHRVAMRGEYAGSAVPWGYVVDYDRHSPTYRRFISYEPHAVLVGDDVFRRFAGMARPLVSELERQWHREGLVWPFFGPDIDERRVRRVDAHCKRDELHGGYVLTFRMAQIILSNVAYLGWQVRAGELAREDDGQPRVCHEPLVDADLFW